MSNTPQDGGPAFPQAQRLWDNDAMSWAVHSVGGMTLRDYFAAAAIHEAGTQLRKAELEESDWQLSEDCKLTYGQTCFDAPRPLSILAYKIADAMLAERAKGGAK